MEKFANYLCKRIKINEDAKRLVLFRLLEGKALEILTNIPDVEKLHFDKQLAALEPRLTTKLDDREWQIIFFCCRTQW